EGSDGEGTFESGGLVTGCRLCEALAKPDRRNRCPDGEMRSTQAWRSFRRQRPAVQGEPEPVPHVDERLGERVHQRIVVVRGRGNAQALAGAPSAPLQAIRPAPPPPPSSTLSP